MPQGTVIFLDTSIQIARVTHSPEIKDKIKKRITEYDITATSSVVKQEFKRRLLKEARYLLQQFKLRESYKKVLRHVIDNLPPQQARKRTICLETLATIDERDDDSDQTDRAILFLKYLLNHGLSDFEKSVDHVFTKSNCACAKQAITKDTRGRYDFGINKCSQTQGKCGITRFLKEHESELHEILCDLKKIQSGLGHDQKSRELEEIENFIRFFLDNLGTIESRNPCSSVGDLLIALESCEIPTFYTMNSKESQFLCRSTKQDLIVRPKNHDRDDIICPKTLEVWPKF